MDTRCLLSLSREERPVTGNDEGLEDEEPCTVPLRWKPVSAPQRKQEIKHTINVSSVCRVPVIGYVNMLPHSQCVSESRWQDDGGREGKASEIDDRAKS